MKFYIYCIYTVYIYDYYYFFNQLNNLAFFNKPRINFLCVKTANYFLADSYDDECLHQPLRWSHW